MTNEQLALKSKVEAMSKDEKIEYCKELSKRQVFPVKEMEAISYVMGYSPSAEVRRAFYEAAFQIRADKSAKDFKSLTDFLEGERPLGGFPAESVANILYLNFARCGKLPHFENDNDQWQTTDEYCKLFNWYAKELKCSLNYEEGQTFAYVLYDDIMSRSANDRTPISEMYALLSIKEYFTLEDDVANRDKLSNYNGYITGNPELIRESADDIMKYIDDVSNRDREKSRRAQYLNF